MGKGECYLSGACVKFCVMFCSISFLLTKFKDLKNDLIHYVGSLLVSVKFVEKPSVKLF